MDLHKTIKVEISPYQPPTNSHHEIDFDEVKDRDRVEEGKWI